MIVTIFLESLAILVKVSALSLALYYLLLPSPPVSMCVCAYVFRTCGLWKTLQRSDLVRFRVTLVGYCFAVYLVLMYYHLLDFFFGSFFALVRSLVLGSVLRCLFTTLGVLQLLSHHQAKHSTAQYRLDRMALQWLCLSTWIKPKDQDFFTTRSI